MSDRRKIKAKTSYKEEGQKIKKYKKATIPKAIREQTWVQTFGEVYSHKCYVSWCENEISVFDYHVRYDVPESKGGKLDVKNLKPICARCNLSMSNNYTIKEWNKLSKKKNNWWCCFG